MYSLNHRFLWLVTLAVFLTFALGCAVTSPRPVPEEGIEEIRPEQIIQREKSPLSPGPSPFSEKVAPVTKGLLKERKLYSMSFDRAQLGEIILAVIRDTDLSLSVESGVDLARPVTVHMKNSSLLEALDAVVVKGAGYAWKMEGDFLEIKRFEERIYAFDYLDMPGSTDIEIGGDMLASSVEDSGVKGKYQVNANREKKNTDIWGAVQSALEGLKSPDGILQLNRASGVIYMADTPRRVETMVRFLDSLAESLHRQVFIEAKIMEVRLSDSCQYGIDWTKLDAALKNSWGPDIMNLTFNRGGAIILSETTRFSAVIDFLHTQGDVTVLSNPHLSVINGQSAVMTVGFQFPYADISGVNRDEETKVVTFDTSIKRTILGLQMGITTQISGDGIIMLHIVPTITRMQDEVEVEIPTGVAEIQTITNPIIDLQELATTVRVREGQSVVLAGLIRQVRQLRQEGLPFLSKIPLLGYLFKHMEETNEKSELVVFITPYLKEVK